MTDKTALALREPRVYIPLAPQPPPGRCAALPNRPACKTCSACPTERSETHA